MLPAHCPLLRARGKSVGHAVTILLLPDVAGQVVSSYKRAPTPGHGWRHAGKDDGLPDPSQAAAARFLQCANVLGLRFAGLAVLVDFEGDLVILLNMYGRCRGGLMFRPPKMLFEIPQPILAAQVFSHGHVIGQQL